MKTQLASLAMLNETFFVDFQTLCNREDLKTFTVLLGLGLSFDLCQKCLIWKVKQESKVSLRVCFTTSLHSVKWRQLRWKSVQDWLGLIKSHLEVCQNREMQLRATQMFISFPILRRCIWSNLIFSKEHILNSVKINFGSLKSKN